MPESTAAEMKSKNESAPARALSSGRTRDTVDPASLYGVPTLELLLLALGTACP